MRTLDHLPGLEAGGADTNPFRDAIDYRTDFLKIRIPSAGGNIMSVRDTIPEHNCLSAIFTDLCHSQSLHELLVRGVISCRGEVKSRSYPEPK